MTGVRLGAIVEGHGEVEAVPLLIRRIATDMELGTTIDIDPILRIPASSLRREGELERQVERAARKMQSAGGILVLIDCDWTGSCPKRDGPVLLDRARRARSDMLISVVLAKREYEAWFIAAAESLRGRRGLSQDLVSDPSPEEIRGAKEWLSRWMPRGRPYSETTDQPAFTAVFDMEAARRADSFDKCYREIVRLLTILRPVE
jgi:hypothetical protein